MVTGIDVKNVVHRKINNDDISILITYHSWGKQSRGSVHALNGRGRSDGAAGISALLGGYESLPVVFPCSCRPFSNAHHTYQEKSIGEILEL